jgi:hypothetical protein
LHFDAAPQPLGVVSPGVFVVHAQIDEAARHRDVVMFIAQAWFDRVISIPGSRYG